MRLPPAPQREVGFWRDVTEWCGGGNDQFGTCSFAALGNLHVLVTTFNGAPEVMSDGEIENVYSRIAGFSPLRPETDRGAQLLDVLRYWEANGWPTDPTLKPRAYWSLSKARIAEGIASYAAVYCWCLLPMAGEDEPEFTDAALRDHIPGTVPHAVLIVGADADGFYLVTWAHVVRVSEEWWSRYGCEQLVVEHPAWRLRVA